MSCACPASPTGLQDGAKDTAQRIQERLEDITGTHEVSGLPAKALSEIRKIRIRGEKELTS